MKARFLWITDPWDTLDHARDTSLRLAEESLKLGHESYWCSSRSITLENEEVFVRASRIESIGPGRAPESFRLSAPKQMRVSEFTSLQYRTDPPVDLAYLHPMQLLLLSKQKKLPLVNPAEVLMAANEKLEASRIPGLMPKQLVAGEWETLEAFGRKLKKTVLKPLHQAQSKGIELLDWTTDAGVARAREIADSATEGFTRPVLLQAYLPGIKKGEVRLWFLDGKLLACVKKLPLTGDFRVNIDRGSRLAPHILTAREKQVATRIGRHLRARKIRLAAVDLIDGCATDFNFTSPGLIVQMEQILGRNLAGPIVKTLARRK